MKNDANEICKEFLDFLFSMKQWMNERYLKEFNVNGKGSNDLTARQFHILIAIYYNNACTISDLEQKLQLSGSSLSISVSKLVQENYLRREYPYEGEDRRKMYLYLTEQGEKVLQETHKRVMKACVNFYEELDDNKKQDFKEGVNKLSSIFKDD